MVVGLCMVFLWSIPDGGCGGGWESASDWSSSSAVVPCFRNLIPSNVATSWQLGFFSFLSEHRLDFPTLPPAPLLP